MFFLVKLNPEFWSYVLEELEEAKATLALLLLLLGSKKKTYIVRGKEGGG